MRREDIDKKIGMPDVDAEWAKFEREVIGQPKASRKPLYWGVGIAASITLVAGIFLLGQEAKDPQTIAQQNTPAKQKTSAEATAIEDLKDSPEKDVVPIIETKQQPSSGLLVQVTLPKREGVADDELQDRIAGLNIDGIEIPDSVRQARRDSILRQREINMDSMLIVVNGIPIPSYKFRPNGVAIYLYKQHQLLSDSDEDIEERISRAVYRPYGDSEEERKRRCFETYGERAKYGVMEVTTVPDTYCDDYISKHPESKNERHHIEGYVYDEDNKPLADSWVYIRGKGIGAATDSIGYFSIWLPKTDVELKASHVGYVPCVIKTIKPMLIIRLRSATTIREVKVTPKTLGSQVYNPIDILTTSVDDANLGNEQFYNVYDLNGVKVFDHARSLDSLQPGIYIINGKKQIIK